MSEYEQNIKECITIILGTKPGERQMLPEFGSRVNEMMFAPNTRATSVLVSRYVRRALERWEPRIEIDKVDAFPDAGGQIKVHVHYRIRSTMSEQEMLVLLTSGG